MESKFNVSKINENADGSTDYGIFQINSHYWCNNYQSHSENYCHVDCEGLAWVPGWEGRERRPGCTHRTSLSTHSLGTSLESSKSQEIPLLSRGLVYWPCYPSSQRILQILKQPKLVARYMLTSFYPNSHASFPFKTVCDSHFTNEEAEDQREN